MSFNQKEQTYSRISQNEECPEQLLVHGEHQGANREKGTKRIRSAIFAWILIAAMILLNLVLTIVLVFQKHNSQVISERMSCPPVCYPSDNTTVSYRSAIFDKVTRKVNGTLFPPKQPSWSRLGPGPEADKYWEWFEPIRLVPLSESDVLRLGKDPAKTVQFTDDWDVPKGSYMGAVDVFHKIHCLNELRQMTFEGYPVQDMPKTYKKHSPLQWVHLRHCVDMIAQDIQCNAKLDIMTYSWVDTQKKPFPDFSIFRTCTNWDQLLDWSIKSTLNPEKFPSMRRPADKLPIPAEDGYYEMFGFEDSVLYPSGKGYKAKT